MKTNDLTDKSAPSTSIISDLEISIRALVYMVIMREGESANRMLRTQGYVKTLANALHTGGYFDEFFKTANIIDILTLAAPLHDIGNTGIPDRILLKPGPLTVEESDIMKTHPELGLDIMLQVERDLGKAIPLTVLAKEIVYHHHERWDGSGYPNGITGRAIPVSARIFMLTDVYDALVSKRVYKAQIPHSQAVKFIVSQRGKLFDPVIADVFECIHEEFHRIAHTHADTVKDIKKKIDFLEQAMCIEP